MMSILPMLTARRVIRALERAGFDRRTLWNPTTLRSAAISMTSEAAPGFDRRTLWNPTL